METQKKRLKSLRSDRLSKLARKNINGNNFLFTFFLSTASMLLVLLYTFFEGYCISDVLILGVLLFFFDILIVFARFQLFLFSRKHQQERCYTEISIYYKCFWLSVVVGVFSIVAYIWFLTP